MNSMPTNPDRVFTGLNPAQADGLACVHCGTGYLTAPVSRQPVGRSETDSQVFACVGKCAEQTDRDAMPYWQTEPCPAWCGFADLHDDEDAVVDRSHFSSWRGQTVLSLVDVGLPERLCGRTEPEFANVHIQQHYREAEPRVWLGRSETNSGWHMTLGEARALAAQLTKAVDLAEGHWGAE